MDMFQCDKCKTILPKQAKRGRLTIAELGSADGMPHPSYFNCTLEICERCFLDMKQLVTRYLPDMKG